jgi:sporulation protein YlmC with PRC-barrel domain
LGLVIKTQTIMRGGTTLPSPALPLHHHSNTQEADMKKLASAAVLLLIVSAGAWAQTPSETSQPPPSAPEAAKPEAAPPAPPPPEAIQPGQPSPEAAKPAPSAPKGAETMTAEPSEAVSVTEYYKQNVYDASDNAIGEVSDVLLDKDGRVRAAIVSVGGFLGLGTKYVSVPFNALRVTAKDSKRYLVMDTTKDVLTSAPGYQYDKTKGQWVQETR